MILASANFSHFHMDAVGIFNTRPRTCFVDVCQLAEPSDVPPSAGNTASVAASGAATFPDDDIAQLCGLGNFSRAQVVEALTVCDGSTERAATFLFQQGAA